MIITVHMLDGRKITQDTDNLQFFNPMVNVPDVRDGCININVLTVLYMHAPDEDELKHLENHGW